MWIGLPGRKCLRSGAAAVGVPKMSVMEGKKGGGPSGSDGFVFSKRTARLVSPVFFFFFFFWSLAAAAAPVFIVIKNKYETPGFCFGNVLFIFNY